MFQGKRWEEQGSLTESASVLNTIQDAKEKAPKGGRSGLHRGAGNLFMT